MFYALNESNHRRYVHSLLRKVFTSLDGSS